MMPICQILPLAEHSITALFTSLWAAIDGHALKNLERIPASTALLKAALECLVFLATKMYRSSTTDDLLRTETVCNIVEAQMKRAWHELTDQRLKPKGKEAAIAIANNLTAFASLKSGKHEASLSN